MIRILGLSVCGVLWLLSGCSDANRIEDAGTVFGTSGNGGASGVGAGGNGGNGGNNTQTGGTGGGNPFGDGGAELECDTSVPTTATCGGTACPAPEGFAAMTCVVPCCVDDQCGTRRASMQFGSECAVPPEADDRCPSEELFGMTVEGCCTDDNRCGIIDTILTNSCRAREDIPQQIADLDPQSCDGTDDAGL